LGNPPPPPSLSPSLASERRALVSIQVCLCYRYRAAYRIDCCLCRCKATVWMYNQDDEACFTTAKKLPGLLQRHPILFPYLLAVCSFISPPTFFFSFFHFDFANKCRA
jgi:hypothetical protein